MDPGGEERQTPGDLRVLHLIDHLGRGGAQTFVVTLAGRLKRQGVDVAICSLRGPQEEGPPTARLEVPVWHVDRKIWDPRQFFAVLRLLERERFDVVHAHLSASCLFGPVAARLARVPRVIVHDHGGANFWTGPVPQWPVARWLYLILDRLVQRWVDHVIAVSKFVASYRLDTRRSDAARLRVIPNFVDLASLRAQEGAREEVLEEFGLSKDALIIGTAGRLAEEKGHHVLLEAMAVSSHVPADAVLLLVGDGQLRQELEERAEGLGLAGRTRITGWREDAPRLITAMDVFVMPSLFETFGNALVEAMALGKPVIATSVGGMPEILSCPEFGVLVPPNDPGALAEAIGRLSASALVRQTLGAAGRRHVEENFSLDVVTGRISGLYAELCGERPSARASR